MSDTIGKLPEITNAEDALKEIIYISGDKREHLRDEESLKWLKLKMKAIRKIAKMGLEIDGEA